MKKHILLVTTMVIIGIVLMTWLPCQADDISGCYKKNKGTLRILPDPSKGCLKSEIPITLQGKMDTNPVPGLEGELCWDITVTQTFPDIGVADITFPAKGYITYVGDGMYRIDTVDIDVSEIGASLPLVGQGSAVLKESDLIINMNFSHDQSPYSIHETGTASAILSTDSSNFLNGTFWMVTLSYDSAPPEMSPDFFPVYEEGIFTATECE